MDTQQNGYALVSKGSDIIGKAESVELDPRVLYEVVIDIASEGLITANCINMAAGILLHDLGLPNYFFKNISQGSLKHILESIATSIKLQDGKVILYGRVAHVDFDLSDGSDVQQRVRIATAETRDSMEKILEALIAGHRREYYYSPENRYYTYIIRPETVNDYPKEDFADSRFLFNLAGDFTTTPEPTRQRYERFLLDSEKSVYPLIEVFNLPETGETRLMFNSDFASPQLPILRKLMEDHGLTLIRAYWEPYLKSTSNVPSSICSLYVKGELTRNRELNLTRDLCNFLSWGVNSIKNLYTEGKLSFNQMLFAGNAVDFTNMFIFKESENITDREIMESLSSRDHKEAFANRLHDSNKSTYLYKTILETVENHPDLIEFLYSLFEKKFDPAATVRLDKEMLDKKREEFNKIISARFIDFKIGYDIFNFMFKIVSCTLKTNFYKDQKRSFAFRFDDRILDPLVYSGHVYGLFFINGHYACGTHLRADDIARGGLRMIRVSETNHMAELENAVLLNYALGPRAQRLKHKDICESGSKGVVVPHSIYAGYTSQALFDYTEGIMDLMMPDDTILDYYGNGRPEMIFFGPDEGTAPLMDAVAFRAKERGYAHWRTITTGKSFGIPHDTYGLLKNGDLFGLFDKGEEGTELAVNGRTVTVSTDMDLIHDEIGGSVEISGMTTTSVMGCFRTLISHYGAKEQDLNLMMTGGPDGDLGANEIQCYKGNICLVIDGGSILFDPDGLDKKELMKIAFMRHSDPRADSLAFNTEKLGERGFMVPLKSGNVQLPDGTVAEDGAMFHRTFLTDPANRRFIEQANIRAFIPCGGFKDTINHRNAELFTDLFKELEFIVEGANVFFDDTSRRHIAGSTRIKQIKDSTANKGGVFSSSVSEVLTAFLLGDDYEPKLLHDIETRWAMIRDIMTLVDKYSRAETDMLIRIHEANPETQLFDLSEKTSEQIFSLQNTLVKNMEKILKDTDLVKQVLTHYIPPVLIRQLGIDSIMETLNQPELAAYRDAIITKKLASMAFYRFGLGWDEYLDMLKKDFSGALHKIMEGA
ncbi:MAG: NAD-glutamate dehydrogenase [Desulfobacteraceae bacterium]